MPAAQEPADAPRRERPLYERADELRRVASAKRPGWEGAWGKLQRLADELSDQGYGIETFDPDMLLASVVALSHLAVHPSRAAELREIAAVLDSLLDTAPEPDPDHALALAWARNALARVDGGLDPERGIEELSSALRHAATIDPRDQRDAFGCMLAEELHARLRAAGRAEEARDALAEALRRFPDDFERRPFLACGLADEWRVQGRFELAWYWIQEAERGLAGGQERHDERLLDTLERDVAGSRCQLELAWGLVDLAAASLARESAVVLRAGDPGSRLSLLLNVSGVALASNQPATLRLAMAELDRALQDEGLFADQPGHRAAVRARRALLQDMLEDIEPASAPRAAELVDAALADPELDSLHRRFLELKAVALANRAGDLDAATARLAAIREDDSSSAELRATLSAWRATLALARAADRNELERLAAELDRHHEEFLASWSSVPAREGGLGYLAPRDRLLLLGARLELCLRLGGAEARERAIDLLLPEQTLGSLARRLRAEPGSVAAVRRELLGPETGMLLYLPGYQVAHLFCIDDESIEHVAVPWKFGRERRPAELDALLADSPAGLGESERVRRRAQLERISAELADRLLPAAARARLARWKSGVYVVGADLLGGIPFDLLPVGGKPLGLSRPLASLPSLPVALVLAARPRLAPARDLLLVAAPTRTPEQDLAPIPFGAEEMGALTADVQRAKVLSAAEATREGIENEQRRAPALLLHVLAHGVSDLAREAGAGLALAACASAPDGRVWCDEVQDGALPASPLVVLSVCSAARGPRRSGDDGLAQLDGAFLAAGARCVLLSTGDVALEPTLRLVRTFQHALLQGATPAGALWLARCELAQDARFEHPFYWASWRVTGLGLEAPGVQPPGR